MTVVRCDRCGRDDREAGAQGAKFIQSSGGSEHWSGDLCKWCIESACEFLRKRLTMAVQG